MSKDTTGSLLGVTISGISFDVMADSNASRTPIFETEGVPTSGRSMKKKTKRIPLTEGIVIGANASEQELLETIQESEEDVTLSYTTAAGDIYRNTGTINIESMETEEGRVALSLIPTTGQRWVLFEG